MMLRAAVLLQRTAQTYGICCAVILLTIWNIYFANDEIVDTIVEDSNAITIYRQSFANWHIKVESFINFITTCSTLGMYFYQFIVICCCLYLAQTVLGRAIREHKREADRQRQRQRASNLKRMILRIAPNVKRTLISVSLQKWFRYALLLKDAQNKRKSIRHRQRQRLLRVVFTNWARSISRQKDVKHQDDIRALERQIVNAKKTITSYAIGEAIHEQSAVSDKQNEAAIADVPEKIIQRVEENKTDNNQTEMKDELSNTSRPGELIVSSSKTPYKNYATKNAPSIFKAKREQRQLRDVFTKWKQEIHISRNDRVRTPTNSDAERKESSPTSDAEHKEGSPTTPPQTPISPSGSNSQSRGTGTRLLNKEDKPVEKIVSSPSAPALDKTMQFVPPQTGETTPIESATLVSPSVESSPGLMARWGEEGSGWL